MADRSPSSDLGRDPRYQAARTRYRNECWQTNAPCWLCGQPIDYNLRWPHPDSWSLDHKITVSTPVLGARYALDPGNFRPSHLHCNQERGNNNPDHHPPQPSEDWG